MCLCVCAPYRTFMQDSMSDLSCTSKTSKTKEEFPSDIPSLSVRAGTRVALIPSKASEVISFQC